MAYVRLVVLLAFVSVCGLALWYRGNAIDARAEAALVTIERNAAVDANNAFEAENADLRDQAKKDDEIVAGLAIRLSEIRADLVTATKELSDLKDSDDNVRTYLNAPVPDALRRLLDKPSGR